MRTLYKALIVVSTRMTRLDVQDVQTPFPGTLLDELAA